jgi:hypothetical protein
VRHLRSNQATERTEPLIEGKDMPCSAAVTMFDERQMSHSIKCERNRETPMTSGPDDLTEPAMRSVAAALAAALAIVTLLLLALLHVLSPEFDPSWRMVSEYANGRYPWALTLMFVCWALSSWALAIALYPLVQTWPAKLGIAALVIAGIGEAMAAAFDINHPLHMHAAILGMNGLPVAALLVGISFARAGHWGASKRMMLWLSNLPWISIVLMAIAMGLFLSSLSRAGVVVGPDSKPLASLPPGVVAFGGWTNRLLIIAFCAWAIGAARCVGPSALDQKRDSAEI